MALPGQTVAVYGKVEVNQKGRGSLQMIQPQFEILGEPEEDADAAEAKAMQSLEIGRIVPIYESAAQGKLTSRWFRRVIRHALEQFLPEKSPGPAR